MSSLSHKRRKRRLWKIFSSITCEGNFLTINAKSTKVLKPSCVILRGKIPWPKMCVWKKNDYYEVFDADLSLMRNFTFTRAINKYISAFYKVHCKRRMPNEEKGCTWN